jgi:sulfonate transport system permease protein
MSAGIALGAARRDAALESRSAPVPPRRRRAIRLPVGLAVPAAVLVVWEAAARLGALPANLLPPPSAVAATIGDLAARGELLPHLCAKLARVGAGFGLGVAAGTLLGALCGAVPALRRLLDPALQGLKSVPSIAWVPLFILWFGIFEASKVLLIATGVFFPIYLALATGLPGVDRKLVEVARIHRLGRSATIWRVLLPAALPTYLVSLRGGLGLGWMFVVAAEFMGASLGLGYLLIDGQQTGRPATIIAAIALFAVLGKATDALLAAFARRALHWQDAHERGA